MFLIFVRGFGPEDVVQVDDAAVYRIGDLKE